MRTCARWRARRGLQMHAVGLGDGRHQGAGRGLQRNQAPLGQKAQFVEQHAVVRVRHQKYQRVFAGQQRQHGFALGHRTRYQRQRDGIGRQVTGVHHVFAQPAADDVLDLLLRHVALFHQDLADLASDASFLIASLCLQTTDQRAFADDAGVQKGLPQVAGFPYHRVRRGDQFPEGVRILGPLRSYNQVEILRADNFVLGSRAEVKISGSPDLAPLTVIGPKGKIDFDSVAVVALRHIHFTPEQAAEYGLHKGQKVRVKVSGERELVFGDCQVVFTDGMEEPMMHVDVEEANAACITNMDVVEILPPEA